MCRKQLTIGVLVSFCTFVAHATAQRNELSGAQKNELSGLVGRQFISDQIIPASTSSDNLLRFGNGLSFEGNIARRVMDGQLLAVSLEVPVVFNVDEDVHTHDSPVSPGYRAFFVTPAARLNLFAHTAVSPWVSVGGGFSHFNGSATQFGPKTGTTNGVFQIGGAGRRTSRRNCWRIRRSNRLRFRRSSSWTGDEAAGRPDRNRRGETGNRILRSYDDA
jgi:hypothetical protein